MANSKDIPRWAQPLGQEKWERLRELVRQGWDVSDIMRELGLPESKRRSLQVFAEPYGPRRRLVLFGKLKDALMGAGADVGPDFKKSLSLIASLLVSDHTKDSTRLRAFELITKYVLAMGKLMKPEMDSDKEREREEAGKGVTTDPDQFVRDFCRELGVDPPGESGGDG